MPQSYNSTLLGGGSASSPSSGLNEGTNFSSLLGMNQPGDLPSPSSSAGYGVSKQPGGWGSTTAAQQQNLGTDLGVSGMQNLNAASAALSLPMNYYASLLSGNPQTAMQAEAPAVNSVLSQYDTARQATANLSPRGGGTTQTMAQAPYQAAGTVANLLSGAQSTAAAGITSNAGLLGSLGTGETGQSVESLNNILNYILGQQASGMDQQQLQGQLGSSAGQMLMMAAMAGG